MKPYQKLLLLFVFALALNACATKPEEAVQPIGEEAVVQGAAEEGALAGEELGADGRPSVMRVHFAFDSSSVDSDNRETIEAHAAYLTANPSVNIKLEGHADERGTREYNLALGERRAKAVVQMLAVLGIDRSRMTDTSYGEENPLDEAHNEAAWKMNRRVEIVY
jgi:peptidoglycan-associated lipoprotein